MSSRLEDVMNWDKNILKHERREVSSGQYENPAPTQKQILFLQRHTNYSEEQLERLNKHTASLVIDAVVKKWDKF
jgi:hypothetical protein